MDTKHVVTLPSIYIDRCIAQGELIVAGYAMGLNSASRAVSYRGAECDEKLQAEAKMAECAFCVWADIDPFKALHWGKRTDAGFDVVYNDARLDIKWAGPRGRYLIWSKAKNHIFDSKPVDALILVTGERPLVKVRGWLNKSEFCERRQTATQSHVLDEGTWFVHHSNLWSMDDYCPGTTMQEVPF